jgi:phage tail sheath protein FI
MPRATYLAPGVYVEEIPSAQQPIAGVGTNTVGFIGIVPDEILYPEDEPDYDPVVAQAALILGQTKGRPESDVSRGARALIESDIEKLKGEIKRLDEAEIPAADKRVTDAATDPERVRAESAAARTKKRREDRATELEELQKRLSGAPPPAGAPAGTTPPAGAPAGTTPSVLRPYVLTPFSVRPSPLDTKLCTNFSEYTSQFGPFSADDPNSPPGTALYPGHRALTHAVHGFFTNGGTRCFVARVNGRSDIGRALEAMESIDAIAIVAAPGLDGMDVWNELVQHCEACEDRFAILDPPADVGTKDELDVKLLSYDTPSNALPQRNKNAAFYFPYIEVVDPAKQLQDEDPAREVPLKYRGRVYVPPSGHLAGIYARTDEQRGVHKAPANAAILGAVDLKYYVGKRKQELLNPQGVNCIRNMNGNITVWGARTIGGDKNAEWKYISVRRFFLFLRESIDEGTQWVVFEPNDYALWGKIRRDIGAFLTNVWRSGALFGLTPEEAFYVKCDAETNPPEVRDLGMVVVEIGVAIVRPAEFVIFRITQSTGLSRS